jgi:hypothetical protein
LALSGQMSHRKIGERFGVTKEAIQQILCGKTWRHVTGSDALPPLPLPPLMRSVRNA